MTPINTIYQELETRYNHISISTIKSVLRRAQKVKIAKNKTFDSNQDSTPLLDEAEDAFLKYNCAIFTAFRGMFTLAENLLRNEQLKIDLKKEGITFRPVRGCYREADWEYANIEYCFFAYNTENIDTEEFFTKIYTLSARYEQDSFLYKRAGINRTAFLVATTDAGRADIGGNIKFAGQLYMDVPDVEAWTDCSDGRFAFQLKGMLLTSNYKQQKKLKIGEGNIFDTQAYQADGVVVIYDKNSRNLSQMCKEYKGDIPLVVRFFDKDDISVDDIHNKIYSAMLEMKKNKCKTIGFHISAAVDKDYVKGAAVALEELSKWVKRNDKTVKQVVVTDIYGDFGKALELTK